MKTIIVKTQAEYDALPLAFDEYTVIEIRSNPDFYLQVKTCPESSRVEARESSRVVAWGSSRVEARESSRVVAWGSSRVVAWESSHVEAWGSSRVEARESSHVEAWGSSRVEARESSRVEARESSHVEAWGQTTTHHKSRVMPIVHGQSVCFVYNGYSAPIAEAGCTVIHVAKVSGNQGWLEHEGVIEAGGQVILYKRVSSDWLTQENTSRETTWKVGEVKTHSAWDPTREECGGGKFHACSRPYFCDEFRSEPSDRYIAISVKVSDLYAWDGATYPHKIAFREGTVLHECNSFGEEIK